MSGRDRTLGARATLHLHCGWPRTGTSSLQAVLFDRREKLAAAGVAYPESWRGPADGPTHHGIYEMLSPPEGAGALEDLRRFLADRPDRNVVLSAEGLTNWLWPEARLDALVAFLAALREEAQVCCVWTLRRLDAVASSLYLLGLGMGVSMPPPREYFEGWDHPSNPFHPRRIDELFAGLLTVEEAMGGNVLYVKYDSSGAHGAELLRALDLPDPLRAELGVALSGAPRLRRSLTHKQVAVLLNLEALSASIGLELDGAALRRCFGGGALRFDGDRACRLLGDEGRRALHEGALAAARSTGFTPYLDFFGDERLDDRPADPLGAEVLNDADRARLRAHLGRLADSPR